MYFAKKLLPNWGLFTLSATVMSATVMLAGAGLPGQEPAGSAQQLDRQIARLIEQLGDEDYFVRHRAEEELARFSFRAFEALQAATTHEDLEVSARAKYLLRFMQSQWTTEADPPEVKSLLKDYLLKDQAEKLLRMRSLAGLSDHKGIPALCRLARFEKSTVMSKHAAVTLLGLPSLEDRPQPELAELLRKHLQNSRRTGVGWVLTWLQLADHPRTAVEDWSKPVESEQALLARSADQTSPQIVARLVNLQIRTLKRFGRRDQVTSAMRRLTDLETGNAATLTELLDWLVEEGAWELVAELESRFAAQFAGNPVLLYIVAQRQAEQGDRQRAEETAGRALKLNPGKGSSSLRKHYTVAVDLQTRGRVPWARREYRHVIDTDAAGGLFGSYARYRLAEMLHDRGESLQAAGELEPMVKALAQNPHPEVSVRFPAAEIRARMNYFYACHYQRQNDRARQRQHLDKAIAADPSEIDTLIACYRLPDQPPEYRRKILTLIDRSAAGLRLQIAADPSSATPYNQFAWLVGNTEGDFDEALRYSRKSIELSPDYGGYYDTLAHVYFAKGEWEKALKTQTKAAGLEPHSGAIARKLEVFRRKWEEENKREQP